MCFVFILTIDIRNDSIPLPATQQTPKQIPLMVYERPIQGTYPAKLLSSCWDFQILTAGFHPNYFHLLEKAKIKRYKTYLLVNHLLYSNYSVHEITLTQNKVIQFFHLSNLARNASWQLIFIYVLHQWKWNEEKSLSQFINVWFTYQNLGL